jgi:four helix bundle protein
LAEALPNTAVAQTIARQLIRAATSGGANYRAAIRSRSRADFVAKMGIVEEECDETVYWIEILLELGLVAERRTKELQREANEILAVTVSSIKTARKGKSV